MHLRSAWVALALPALLAACAQPQRAVETSRRPVYAIDMIGAAKSCTVDDNPRLIDGRETVAPMTVVNDGGWCALRVARPGPEPFDAGLLSARAENGRVYVHSVGDYTRIDYTPLPGFSGTDSFTVRLLPGSTTVKVNVTVQPGAAAVTPAAAPVAPRVAPPPPDTRAATPQRGGTTRRAR
ncbi:hypothetical protein [Teichococcus aerofrigidensis]